MPSESYDYQYFFRLIEELEKCLLIVMNCPSVSEALKHSFWTVRYSVSD